MDYILGIDQGLSNTRAAVSDTEGNILSYYRTDGACHSSSGLSVSMKLVAEASRGAIENAGIQSERINILVAGMTGADFPDEYVLLHKSLCNLDICQNVIVKNDCIIALKAGTQASFGAIVIAGSGCNCAVISPSSGEFIYHYFVENSLQGGGAISRKILDSIYRSFTCRIPDTNLTVRVLEQLEYNDVESLLRADVENRILMEDRLALVPVVFDEACKGDHVSSQIIIDIAREFAQLIKGGMQKLDILDKGIEIVTSGSIFKSKCPLLLQTFRDEVQRFSPDSTIVNARYEPVVGAVLIGIEKSGNIVDSRIMDNIESTCKIHNLMRIIQV
jgi:N-acetylglucosamine kinase-like BadF-type ATPase